MAVQTWLLHAEGVHHRVEADTGGWRKQLRWWVDDELVVERSTAEDKVELEADDGSGGGAGHGKVALRFSALGQPRRATWYAPDDEGGVDAALGVGGVDLEPEEGSPAAEHERRIREHPRRYEAQRVAAGVAGVVLPILVGLLAVRFAVDLPWPDWDLPSIPWPDWSLPSIPWPSIPLPSVPWPDWSLPDLPGWLTWLLDKAKYVWPIVLAYVLARAEIKRRRDQDRLRAERACHPPVEPGEPGEPGEPRRARVETPRPHRHGSGGADEETQQP
jgi:hypothetical protein